MVVHRLENRILTQMDKCMPLNTIRMSSRDPVKMFPWVKALPKAKSRLSGVNEERLRTINRRISGLIVENRKIHIQ